MATWPPAKSCLVLLDNDIMAAKYEGHSDDDVVTFFFFQWFAKTSPGYRGCNQDYDKDEENAVRSSTATTAQAMYTSFIGPEVAGTHIQHAGREQMWRGKRAATQRKFDRQAECRGHVIKKKNFWKINPI